MPPSQDALEQPAEAHAEARANAPQTSAREVRRRVASASLVTAFEMFDFTVFGYFAAMIGAKFFPAGDPMTSLLLAVGSFGVGAFMRPLGAL
ncbi:hypothetical protein SB751_28705, partial [Cupriavidus sp. SIMBA_020]